MDELMQGIIEGERILVGSDLNEHVGKRNMGYQRILG